MLALIRLSNPTHRPTSAVSHHHAGAMHACMQLVVEKMLAAEGTSRQQLGRGAFEERVWAWKARYGGFITGQMRAMGASCDWSRERFTLDAQLSSALAVPKPPAMGPCKQRAMWPVRCTMERGCPCILARRQLAHAPAVADEVGGRLTRFD